MGRRSGCQLPVQKPDINMINRNVWTDRSSFILQIEHISLAVDDPSVLHNRNVDAGAALGIDQFDGLQHCVPAVRHAATPRKA